MEQYTIHCTEEQTRKAFELGAPIKATQDHSNGNVTENLCVYGDIINKDKWGIGECTILHIPTAGQMLGWLEEQGLDIYITTHGCSVVSYSDYGCIFEEHDVDRKTSTLKAINAALDYLADNNLIK